MIRVVFFLWALFFFAGVSHALIRVSHAAETRPSPECADIKIMAKRMIAERHLAYLSDAIDSNAEVHMWFVNTKTGAWAQLHVKESLEACVEMQGYDWHFAAGG